MRCRRRRDLPFCRGRKAWHGPGRDGIPTPRPVRPPPWWHGAGALVYPHGRRCGEPTHHGRQQHRDGAPAHRGHRTAAGRRCSQGDASYRLNLTFNHIGDVGARAIAKALVATPALNELGLGSNLITDHGTTDLANALKDKSSCLTFLNLSGNMIGDRGATALGVSWL